MCVCQFHHVPDSYKDFFFLQETQEARPSLPLSHPGLFLGKGSHCVRSPYLMRKQLPSWSHSTQVLSAPGPCTLPALAFSLSCPPPGLPLPHMGQLVFHKASSNTDAFVKPPLTIPGQADLLWSFICSPAPGQGVGRRCN